MDALHLITEASQNVPDPAKLPTEVCRDKDDDHVLACAVSADAKYLVTGDKDLLSLKAYKDIRIMAPRDFELLFEDR